MKFLINTVFSFPQKLIHVYYFSKTYKLFNCGSFCFIISKSIWMVFIINHSASQHLSNPLDFKTFYGEIYLTVLPIFYEHFFDIILSKTFHLNKISFLPLCISWLYIQQILFLRQKWSFWRNTLQVHLMCLHNQLNILKLLLIKPRKESVFCFRLIHIKHKVNIL